MNFEKSLFLYEYEPDCFYLKNKDFFIGIWTFDFLIKFYKEFEELLSMEEREKYFLFTNSNYKVQKIISRGLLRKFLSFLLPQKEISFYYNEYGKPFLKNNPFYFNVSHASKHVMIGLSQDLVGVDIEDDFLRFSLDRVNKMIERFFSESEKKYSFQFIGEERMKSFLEIWTRKEAYLKCEGVGINQELSSVDINMIGRFSKYFCISSKKDDFIFSFLMKNV